MDAAVVIRYTIMSVSAVVGIMGLLVMFGWFALNFVPEQFRFISGVVIFLYGTYRFVIAYIKNPNANRDAAR